jgi:hypothetical protein
MNFAELLEERNKGPWVFASFTGGDCSGCGEDIIEDDEIRADGSGGWERRECCDNDDD